MTDVDLSEIEISLTQIKITSEQSNLESLSLLVSQRPTLIRLLQEQNFSALGDYLNTLRDGANLDFVLVCSDGKDVTESNQNISLAAFCLEKSPEGYAGVSNEQYLYSSVNMEALQSVSYRVIVGNKMSSILTELQ